MCSNLCIISLLLIFISNSVYGRCPVICRRGQTTPTVCVINDRRDLCSRMPQCEVDEINCRLRRTNRPSLLITDISNCRNNRFIMFAEPCANRPLQSRAAIRSQCMHIQCPERGDILGCFSSRDNNCQLLTRCQSQRVNCRRSSGNQLQRDDPRRCFGMTGGQALQRCAPVTNRHG